MAIFSPSQSYRALEETQTEADSQGELTGNFYHVFNSTSRLLALDGNTEHTTECSSPGQWRWSVFVE